MNEELKIFVRTLKKGKYLHGSNSREIVKKAIEFNNPPRIPYMFNTHGGDVFLAAKMSGPNAAKKPGRIGATYTDGWGVTWEVTGRGWDHATGYPLDDLSEKLSSYTFPDMGYDKSDPLTKLMIQMGRRMKKYILGVNSINMYELLRSLMGFEGAMMAPYLSPDLLIDLLNRLADMTCRLIDSFCAAGGIDGFITYEDWGLQSGLQMSLEQFREFYKPVYKRIIDHCHDRGIHFIWHSCGDIITLIPEMVDLGVDVVQMDQPLLMGYENLIEASKGELCFFNCVDNQWTARPEVTIDDIAAETERMIDMFARKMPDGGFIMKHYTQPWDIGLSKKKETAIADTFFNRTCRESR
ncbi:MULTISPECIES: uroporphyrinogen decarboxylase family protein [unclassified Oceanispirochaeta]|uniref:uroporphyrinogen decarboxylase family protein n=1 Tax=unclassified Oceanispirochaeta TaxID=2635722 RepID=UPI000E096457|nr:MULTISPECIES: uroporphyrinogen decarboxylase family protein [unclassified Oceanispirochaeta]MBF9017971.1 hypothetical protein [Oceanispirochaeta sp. M2]NPD74482.1 hypothetical protein [Oceanispirochaeta sp. M1]RDG29690.1 hypothetical protein DV872_20470 [Oceanispirochaeta sp. M1]